MKLESVPYLPFGYTRFGDKNVCVGIRTDAKLYLGVWNLHGEKHVEIPLEDIFVRDAKVAYPLNLDTSFYYAEHKLTVDFSGDEQARLFEIDLA